MLISETGSKVNSIEGFSMVEILIVIMLIAFLSTFASSMFSNHVKNRNLKEAAVSLMSDIKLAKQRSAAESANITITIDQDNNNYSLLGTTKNLRNFGNDIFIPSQNYSSNTINFMPRGTCSAGNVVIQNSLGSTIVITTSMMGKVRSVETYK